MTCTTTCVQPSPTNAHCGACHQTFGSVTGFDRHRRGGECIDPTALHVHQDQRGVWRMDGQAPQADAPAALSVQPQSAEDALGVPVAGVRDSEPAESISAGAA